VRVGVDQAGDDGSRPARRARWLPRRGPVPRSRVPTATMRPEASRRAPRPRLRVGEGVDAGVDEHAGSRRRRGSRMAPEASSVMSEAAIVGMCRRMAGGLYGVQAASGSAAFSCRLDRAAHPCTSLTTATTSTPATSPASRSSSSAPRETAAPSKAVQQSLDDVVQRRYAVGEDAPPTRNMAAVPATDRPFISHGVARDRAADGASAASRCASAPVRRRRALRCRHEAVDAGRHQQGDTDQHRDAGWQWCGRHRAERDHDDLGREDEVGADRALILPFSTATTLMLGRRRPGRVARGAPRRRPSGGRICAAVSLHPRSTGTGAAIMSGVTPRVRTHSAAARPARGSPC